MAIKKGRCSNYDGCSKADKDEIIEVDEFDDFVCPECGHPLEPLQSGKKKSSNKMLFIIGGSVVALGIIGAIVFALIGSKSEEKEIDPMVTETAPVDSVDVKKEEATNRNDTLVIKIEGQENLPQKEDTVVDLSEVVTEEVIESPDVDPAPVPTEKPAAKTTSAPATPKSTQSASHKLSYGTWTGGMKNGKPHGTGTLTYSKSQTIDSRDPKGRVAQPGEYIVGEWDNGHLVQGRWFKKDGSKEAVIIGKAG
ncbi:MAG: hypothetical protein K2L45_07955 [Muribaculaceae bacterium]|nr:hypothetical protein [Muribaculaceae bacterium]